MKQISFIVTSIATLALTTSALATEAPGKRTLLGKTAQLGSPESIKPGVQLATLRTEPFRDTQDLVQYLQRSLAHQRGQLSSLLQKWTWTSFEVLEHVGTGQQTHVVVTNSSTLSTTLAKNLINTWLRDAVKTDIRRSHKVPEFLYKNASQSNRYINGFVFTYNGAAHGKQQKIQVGIETAGGASGETLMKVSAAVGEQGSKNLPRVEVGYAYGANSSTDNGFHKNLEIAALNAVAPLR